MVFVRLVATGFLLLLTACASVPPNTGNICSVFDDKDGWFRAARQAEKRWGVPIPVSMAFIKQESGFASRAKPPRRKFLGFIPGPRPSSAFGFAQAQDSTWDDYRKLSGNGIARRSNFADAVDFVAWYNNMSYRTNNIARDDAFNLYLAYHEGNAGFRRRTYEGNNTLINVARKVEANALAYQQQFAVCESELGKNWFERLFS
ncbi:MAG: transglycosylase SLT domain-containing protein [Pseudomonadota bacterium]